MCIINEPAEVNETQLFVAPHSNGLDQITVYANKVKTNSNNNMMLLPVPYPDTVKFIDLQNYQSIFNDLERPFVNNQYNGVTTYSIPESNILKIHNIGSYMATLVPTHKDLDRINPLIFGIVQPNIKSLLNEKYSNLSAPFGYIICKLRSGQAIKYHPFAYRHKMTQNKTGNKILFIPTRHEHGHDHSKFNEADWDHAIYSINTDMQSGNKQQYTQCILQTDKIPNFDLGSIHTINKKIIKGYYPNNDLIFKLVHQVT